MSELMLPSNEVAEMSVLGCILLSRRGQAITQVIDFLKPEYFYFEHFRLTYETMLALFNRHVAIDTLSLSTELERCGKFSEINDRCDVLNLTQHVGSSYQIETHARAIVEAWQYREMASTGTQLVSDAYHREPDAHAKAEQSLFRIGQGRSITETVVSHRTALSMYLSTVMSAHGQDTMSGIPTGFPVLDRKTGGLRKTNFYVVGGRPGDGKSVFGLCLADTAVRAGCTVVFYSLEMSKEELMQRWVAKTAKVNSTHLRDNCLSELPDYEGRTELDKVVDAEAELRTLPGHLLIDDTPANTDVNMRSRSIRLQAEHGLDLIIVDYIQLAKAGDTGGKRLERRLEVEEVSRHLKDLARELQVPVLGLAQLNRDSANEKRPPRLSDFREAGGIENDADVAMMIHRPLVDGNGEPLDPNAEEYDINLHVEKNRHGPKGVVSMHYIGMYTRLHSVFAEEASYGTV